MGTEQLTETLEETLKVFRESAPRAPLTTTEVAEALDLGRRSTYERLDRLVDKDLLRTKKVGARGRVWWQPVTPPDGRSATDQSSEDESSDGFRVGERDQQFRSLVEASEEYAIFMLDPRGKIETWNEGARRIKGYERDEIVGEHVSTFYTAKDSDAGVPEDNLAIAARDGSIEREGWRVRKDGSRFWASVTLTAIERDGELQGYSKVVRDMTDRREQERRLRREHSLLEQILRASPTGIGVFDADGKAMRINRQFASLLEFDRGEADTYELGDKPPLDESGEVIPFPERPAPTVLSTGEAVIDQRMQVEGSDGQMRWLSVNAEPLTSSFDDNSGDQTEETEDSLNGVVVTITDVSQLVEQSDRLERRRDELEAELDDVFRRIDDAFFAVDENWRFTYVNDRAEELMDRTDVIGETVWNEFPEAVETTFWNEYHEAVETQEPVHFEEYFEPLQTWFRVSAYPSETGLSVYFRDVTEEKRHEQELEQYERIVETVDDGVYVLDRRGTFQRVNDGFVSMTGRDRSELIGQHASTVFGPQFYSLDAEAQRLFESGERVVTFEETLQTAADEQVVVENRFKQFGVEGFTGRVGIIRDISDRKAREEELEQQRERLTALDDLNGLFRNITHAVVEQSSREEIEEIVCEHLADANSYDFAWIGDVNVHDQTVELRTEAGVEGYLDGITISVDPDDERSGGPTGRAVLTHETQITNDVRTDSHHDPWRDHVREHGFRSSAAIPILHEGTLYGVLNVYAKRPYAFHGDERAVVDQLGEVIGHAIAAVERKRALMSDEVTELEFHISDVFEEFDIERGTEDKIALGRVVPIGDEQYLVYGETTEDGLRAVESIVDDERIDHWREVSVLEREEATDGSEMDGSETDGSETDDTAGADAKVRFELRLREPPVLLTVASKGGYIHNVRFEGGDYFMQIHLPTGTDTGPVVEAIRDAYPTIELVTRQQVTREEPELSQAKGTLLETLTDRQRSAVEAAYHAGYFAWPRRSDGTAVAESLGVSSPTFHQHLRKAEDKLLSGLFEDVAGSA